MSLILFQCRPDEIDRAWRDGAHRLSEATKWAAREITTDQLKMLLSRGERVLLGARDETGVKGWAAIQVQQLPNIRCLYIYALQGHGICSAEGVALLRQYAQANGCTTIRGAVRASMARLLTKLGGKPLYMTYELEAL
jgi:hypothetical protein